MKLLGIISLILAIVLFPPAALAVLSNNAVQGDSTYPIKRGLEDVIYAVASLNPTTKAWFSAARSDRRFKELNILATQGKQTTETINELVVQTQVVATQLNQVKDPVEKEKLKQQLVDSITKYDQELKQIANTQLSTVTPIPTSTPIATTTPIPQVTPRPITHIVTPTPVSVPTQRPTPIPTSTPTPTPTPINNGDQTSCDSIANEYQRARCQLGQIQVGLNGSNDEKKNSDSEKVLGKIDNVNKDSSTKENLKTKKKDAKD